MISRMSCRVSLSIGEQSIFRKAIFIRLSPSKRERPASRAHQHAWPLRLHLPEPVARGELRPLRSPAALSDDA